MNIVFDEDRSGEFGINSAVSKNNTKSLNF